MDGESIGSQSRHASQNYSQTSSTQAAPSISGAQTTEEKAAAAAANQAGAATNVADVVDEALQDGLIEEHPTAQAFEKPIIRTFSDNMSRPVLPQSTGGTFDDAAEGFRLVTDPNLLIAKMLPNAEEVPWERFSQTEFGNIPSVEIDYNQYPEILNGAAQTGLSPSTFFARVQQWRNIYFERSLNGLPQDQADQLRAAYYMPNAAKELSPELKALQEKLNKFVDEQTGAQFNLSQLEGLPVDSRDFLKSVQEEVGQVYDQAFAAAVENGDIKTISTTEVNEVSETAATEDADAPPGTENVPVHIQNLVKRLNGLPTFSLQEMAAKYNAESEQLPPPDISYYNNVVNGDFSSTMTKNIKGYYGNVTDPAKQIAIDKLIANPLDATVINDPNLSEADKKELIELAKNIAATRSSMLQNMSAFLTNPDDPNISSDVKTALQGVFDISKSATMEKYGLDNTWTPTVPTISATDRASISRSQTALDTANEILNSANQVVDKMVDGSMKSSYINFLNKIALALNELQNTIYAIQGSNSQSSKKTNALKLQTQLANLSQQKTAAEEAAKKSGKMAKMGPLADIVKWISYILIVACAGLVAGFLFPIGMLAYAAAIAYIVQNEKDPGNNFIAQACQVVTDGCCEVFGEKAGMIISGFVNLFTVALLSGGNPMLILTAFFQDSQATQNLVAVCGGGEMAQQLTAQILLLVIQIAIMVAITVATFGAAAPATVPAISADVALAGATSAVTAEQVMQMTMIAIQIIVEGLTIASSGIQLNNSIILAQITKIRAKSEKLAVELEAIIAILKKLVDKLLDALNGLGDWTVNIQKQVGDLFSKASSISTDITFAG